jgi:UDP-N-acetylglucosamine 2-epimerase (non-hydrolysing)/GDP/UDP-N,N'-diacetylbacillosamine 2-epimerase (hydrolysing)
VGALGLEYLEHVDWIDRGSLEAQLQLPLGKPLILMTYHPATLAEEEPVLTLAEVLSAFEEFPEATVVITYPNADAGGRKMIECIDSYVALHPRRTKAFASLGQSRYLSVMRFADVVVGNSSSGLTEAPALEKATVNIGDRQRGRLKATSVIDVAESKEQIVDGIRVALSVAFQSKLSGTASLYGGGNVSAKIVAVLREKIPTVSKKFFDIEHEF